MSDISQIDTAQNPHWQEYEVRRGLDSIWELYMASKVYGYIAGSYAAFMACCTDDPILPNDVDVFAVSKAGADIIVRDLTSGLGFRYVGDNEVCTSLTRGDMTAQIINPNPEWKDFPGDLLNSFDLDVCRAVLVSETTVLADAHIGWRQGKILRTRNPLRSLKRVLKYHERGVEFSDHELLKLFRAWDQVTAERKAELIQLAHDEEFPPFSEPQEYDVAWDEDDYYEGE